MSSMKLGPATVLAGALAAGSAHAVLPNDELGATTLPFPPEAHRAYIVDMEFDTMVSSRVTVVDPDARRMLGMVSTGGAAPATLSRDGKRLYTADMFYTRYTRGTRSDFVTAWDTSTLSPLWEVEIPPRRASTINERYQIAASDDDRFVYVYNLSPSTSITVVDAQAHKVISEIAIPGCALDYPAGPRRFASICGDGTLLLVSLDDAGQETSREKVPFFKPEHEQDLVLERAVAKAGVYHFVSYAGVIHSVDLSGEKAKVLEPWSLLSADEAKAGWAPGGWQLLALSPADDRLFVLMHPDNKKGMHKDPSTVIWVYDLKTHKKLGALESPNPIWTLQATRDDKPLLLGMNIEGGLEIFDLTSMKHVGGMPKIAKTSPLIMSH